MIFLGTPGMKEFLKRKHPEILEEHPKDWHEVVTKETWDEYIDNDCENYEAVKTYVGLKVKMLFDPPTSSTLMTCLKEAIAECEWRLNFNAELSK